MRNKLYIIKQSKNITRKPGMVVHLACIQGAEAGGTL